jgi:hypothetical protein
VLPALADEGDTMLNPSTIAVAKAYFAEQFLTETELHEGTPRDTTSPAESPSLRG